MGGGGAGGAQNNEGGSWGRGRWDSGRLRLSGLGWHVSMTLDPLEVQGPVSPCVTPGAWCWASSGMCFPQDHALVPAAQEPQGLCLGPAWSLNPSFLPHQGPWQQTSQVPQCPHCPLVSKLSLWTQRQWDWGALHSQGLPTNRRDPKVQLPWQSAGSWRGFQARPESAAETEETSICIQPAAT